VHILHANRYAEFGEDSILAKMFSDDSPFGAILVDQEQRPFIDRDGDISAHVLDYLRRSGRFVGAQALWHGELERLHDDAEFYGLAGLVQGCENETEERAKEKRALEERRLQETLAAEQRHDQREKERVLNAEKRHIKREAHTTCQYEHRNIVH
jgi:hypothetical protein